MGYSEDFNFSHVRVNQVKNTFESRGLSCAIRAEVAKNFSSFYRKRDAFENSFLFGNEAEFEGFVKILDFDDSGHLNLHLNTNLQYYTETTIEKKEI